MMSMGQGKWHFQSATSNLENNLQGRFPLQQHVVRTIHQSMILL
jgi:hypothetical protein